MQIALGPKACQCILHTQRRADRVRKPHARSIRLNPGLSKTLPDSVGDKVVARFAAMTPLSWFRAFVRVRGQWYNLR
jgi:hypothetical protein